MPQLKDYFQSDADTFFNNGEFGSTHNINGRALNIVVDNEQLMQRIKKEYDGIYVGEILYFVSAEEYGDPPKIDEAQTFNNRFMTVFDVKIDEGMYEIILQGSR